MGLQPAWLWRVSLAALFQLPSALAQAQDTVPCDIHYEVTPRYNAKPRALAVTVTFAAENRRETVLRIAGSWAGINDFGAAFSSFNSDDAQVRVEPIAGAQRWLIKHPARQAVTLNYQVRAALPDPDDGQPQQQEQLYRPQLAGDWFQFFGHAVFPSLDAWDDNRNARMCVTLLQPGQPMAPAFGSHHAARGEVARAAFTGSPSLLNDAFYAGGLGWRVLERPVAGGTLRVAVRSKFEMRDEQFADASQTLVDMHRRFWNENRSAAPWLVLTPNFQQRNVGGTLVNQAIAMHAGPGFKPSHPSFEFLVGHEHLHEWFDARFGGSVGDPVKAVHGYWFSEGFTNYYTHRLLLASGLWSLQRYAENLQQNLRSYWQSQAREMPVATIAPIFFSDRDAGQQLYSRGEWLAMRWDRLLREQGHAGLDAVLRGLILPERARDDVKPLATERVLAALEPLLSAVPRRDVASHIERGAALTLDEGLAGPCFSVGWREEPRWVLGLDDATFKTKRATGVAPGGPAFAAGLREGMEVLGWSVYGGDIHRDVEIIIPGKPGQRTLRYKPVDGTRVRLPTASVRADAASSAACQTWLQR